MKTILKKAKKTLSLILVLIMVCTSLPVYVTAEDEDTTGFIEVRTVEDLYNIRNDLTANYILMNDIDLTEATAVGGDWDYGGRGWNPIGGGSNYKDGAFSGTFDGNGHKIIGMRIEISSSTGYPSGTDNIFAGLFAYVTGSVYDLTFEGGSISVYGTNDGYYVNVGALAGANSGNLTNISSNMDSISAYSGRDTSSNVRVGGIAGYHGGSGATIYYSNNSTPITVTNYCNSLSSSSSSYYSNTYAGGICGYSYCASVSYCFNTGNIVSITMGNYSPDNYTGGIVGYLYSSSSSSYSTVSNCYNVGSIKVLKSDWTTDRTALTSVCTGIAYNEYDYSKITNCYNTQPAYFAISNKSVTSCYYLNGSGKDCTGATALSDAQMKLTSTYNGFDFNNVWVLNPNAVNPYPQLRNNIQDLNEGVELIRVVSLPQTTTYYTGEALDLQGALIEIVYPSGKTEMMAITEDMISGYDPNSAKEQTITVKYKEKTSSFTVTVIERPKVEAIYISKKPTDTEILVGTNLDLTGAKVDVAYANGTSKTFDLTMDMISGLDINKLGKQTVTVTIDGCTDSFSVTVVPIQISSITLKSLPTKVEYLEGDELDLTGMSLTAVFNNGTQKDIASGFEVSGYSSQPGTHTVTVKYLNFTTEFDVTVAEKQVVALTLVSKPAKTEYYEGEALDTTGMVVTAKYNSGVEEAVTDYTITGLDGTAGLKTIAVSYGGYNVTFIVRVLAKTVTDFSVTTLPTKVVYIEGESADYTGMVVKATFNNGNSEVITDYTVVGFASTPGKHTVSVSYDGYVDTFEITVVAKELVDLKITAPEKQSYFVGEELDLTGLSVMAYYNNGTTAEIGNYGISGFDSKTPGTKTITVTFGTYSRSFAVVVLEKEPVVTNGKFEVSAIEGRLGETVEVDVTVTGNPGIAGLKHTITFDSADLKYVSVSAKGDFAEGTVVVNSDNASKGEITVVWFSPKDVEAEGVVYSIEFEVLETAADGVSDVELSFEENGNGNATGEDLIFNVYAGSVDVKSWWLGDIDGDRLCSMADLLQLARYVAGEESAFTAKQKLSADTNEDGVVDIHDVTLLSQWLLEAEM